MKAFLAALALGCAAVANAQAPAPAAQGPAAHFEQLAVLLDLTDAQKTQVQAILEQEHAKVRAALAQALAADTQPDPGQMRTLHRQIHEETLQRLTPVLSELQLKKFTILTQMHPHGPFGHHGFGPDAPPPPPG